MSRLRHHMRWSGISLPGQFLLAGGVVMSVAMGIVGLWVSSRIEQAVVENSANAAALYMESFVSPLSQELALDGHLSVPAKQALHEIFQNTPLGERVVSFKIWMPGGLVIHASDPDIIGRRFDPPEDLQAAWSGKISGSYEELDNEESRAEQALGVPLLEVYSPIRELWSGKIIAVVEFYERAEMLSADIASARRTTWMVVGATFLSSGLLLFGIVNAGGRVIRRQSGMLQERLEQSEAMARQNIDLRARVVQASARASAQADRYLRQLGSDLHDGPAQHLALASMRLDKALEDKGAKPEAAEEVYASLKAAMAEIRSISRGLAIPDLDGLDLHGLIERAISDHSGHNDIRPALAYEGETGPDMGYTAKLCVFRFLQETLSNAARHAPGAIVRVACKVAASEVGVSVQDNGPGFDPKEAMQLRADGGQGLLGLVDRAESIGGRLVVESKTSSGAAITLFLPLGTGDSR